MQGLTKLQIIALVGFFIVLISIPLSFSLVKQTQIFSSKASQKKNDYNITPQISGAVTTPRPIPTNSPLTDLQSLIEDVSDNETPAPDITPNPGTQQNLAFGPTLNLRLSLEGRPRDKQAGKVFVGISSGNATTSPTYILTFTIDLPDNGMFKGLSLAGLNPGSVYTAYIKGASQIDTASTFTMSPTETNLNNDQPLNLTTGDLNEDNVINSTDYTIARSYYGTTPTSNNWNERVDFNKDRIINNYDLLYINNNMGKVGASGTWISTPLVSTPSAALNVRQNVGGPPSNFGDLLQISNSQASETAEPIFSNYSSGYWLYVP